MASTTAVVQDAQKPHATATKLEDHAALAALYVTKYDASSKNGQAFLDRRHRLSSAGAAASLKYANPQDLPSYPSSGLKKNDDSAAGAAASLGWAKQKPFEHWKPDPSASASAAAMMAKDYKMKELWQPEQSTHGAKAALLAHKDGGKVEIWKPEADSPWGNSAALQAFKKFGAGGLSPVLDYGYTDLGRKGSLMAATGAMSQSRQRAISTPEPRPKPETYPDESNAVSNALSAANSAHRTQKRSELSETGAVPYTTMNREMYTSHPPVASEVDEKNRADTLHASAVAMARQMYTIQQKQIEQTSHAQRGAAAAHHRKTSSSDVNDEVQPMRFNNLQEAAQKLAQTRLAKLHDEHAQNREYRDYYGGKSQPTSRLSIRGRVRRRASSEGGLNDEEQSNKIRAQMSLFSSNLSQVDEKKRARDREALIAAAQRNVTKSLHGMDERVFADTGKVAPSLLSEWEVKAHAAAQAKSNTRMENYGKVHIGGGKYIDQSEVDAVARGNVQPVLDEINAKAAAEHERQAAVKAEQLEIARKASEKKQREKESKAINKKLKQQDKDEEKLRIKEEREEKKAAQRAGKENRKSGTAGAVSGPEGSAAEPTAASPVAETGTTAAAAATETEDDTPVTPRREALDPIRTSMEDQASLRMRENADAANPGGSTPLSPGPGNPDTKGKVRLSWLKTKFSRRMSRGDKGSGTGDKEAAKEEKGFVGGTALTGASVDNTSASLGAGHRDSIATSNEAKTAETVPAAEIPITEAKESEAVPHAETSATIDPATEIEEPASLPIAPESQEPALDQEKDERIGRAAHREEEISPISPDGEEGKDIEGKQTDEEEFQEARDNFDEDLAPPPTFPAEKSRSPARETKFKEAID